MSLVDFIHRHGVVLTDSGAVKSDGEDLFFLNGEKISVVDRLVLRMLSSGYVLSCGTIAFSRGNNSLDVRCFSWIDMEAMTYPDDRLDILSWTHYSLSRFPDSDEYVHRGHLGKIHLYDVQPEDPVLFRLKYPHMEPKP